MKAKGKANEGTTWQVVVEYAAILTDGVAKRYDGQICC